MASDHRPKMIEPVGICELFTAFRPASAEVTSQEASSLPKARVLVVVRDSGPGLDSTQLQRVFETYYTTKSQGLGMGLAISRSIIEAHGGRLWAKRNTPRGALFKFTLPVLDLPTMQIN